MCRRDCADAHFVLQRFCSHTTHLNWFSLYVLCISAILLLVPISLDIAEAVQCRSCANATSLADCTMTLTCKNHEECYMDQIIQQRSRIVYNGGCRSRSPNILLHDIVINKSNDLPSKQHENQTSETSDCRSSTRNTCQLHTGSGTPVGRRSLQLDKRAGEKLTCSYCCNTNATNGVECNTKLCGIQGASRMTQCYTCDSTQSGRQGDVHDPSDCNTITYCQSNEVCEVQQFALGTNFTYRYNCANRQMCTFLTQYALQDMNRCRDPSAVARGECGSHKRSAQAVCTACCGDSLCNSDTCYVVLDRLYALWRNGLLDFATLQQGGIPSSIG